MTSARRQFIKDGVTLIGAAAALPMTASGAARSKALTHASDLHDGGMQLSEAYFWGMEKWRMDLARQINVLGAVGFVDPAGSCSHDGRRPQRQTWLQHPGYPVCAWLHQGFDRSGK